VTTLDVTLPPAVLGVELTDAEVVDLIETVGAQVERSRTSLRVTAPTWRPDLTDPYDYVEEVGRLAGYDTIPAVVPRAPVGRGLTRSQRARRAVTAAAVDAGFVEVLSFPFIAAEDLDRMGVVSEDRRRRLTRILNPLAETSPYLRTSLLPGLFAAVTRNTSRGNDDLALFETGSVFFAPQPRLPAPRPPVETRPSAEVLARMDDALGDQPRHLAAVLTGAWRRPGWAGAGERAGWQHALGLADLVGHAVGLDLTRRAADQAPWHPGRCAAVVLPGTAVVVGHAGELHPRVVAAFGLPQRAAAVELNLDVLLAAAPEGGEIPPLSSHPVAKEDVALIVDAEVPAAEVEAALRAGAGALLESVHLFDIYTGPQVGEGRKSLAFALRFRAPDRTLTDAETAAARAAAVAQAGRETGAVQRTE
jgi:phenylalanyl-tRNA synthetase beta chain